MLSSNDLRLFGLWKNGVSGSVYVLIYFGLVVQAALSDGVSFDPFTFEQDGLAASEVDVGWGEIVEAFVVSMALTVR